MNVDTMHKGPDLEPTSRNAHRREQADSEADFLAREIANAKLALINTTEEIRGDLRQSLDLPLWVRKYPWIALGVASAAGFALATVVTPEPGQSIRDKWSQLASSRGTARKSSKAKPKSQERPREGSIAGNLFGPLFDLAKLVVEGLIVAAARAPSDPPHAAGEHP